MTTSFNELKRTSSSGADFEKLNKELTKLATPTNGRDERLWSCARDKAGNGYAVIRFLPAPAGEDVPFVRIWSHGFKGPGGWYIENSLSTLGQDDPCGEMNTKLWNEGEGSNGRRIVSGSGKENPGSKRQLNYYSNIYVIHDPMNPENEGKVFLFRYGAMIFDHLKDLMAPTPLPGQEATPVDPFNLWTGANFQLKIRKKDGYANYDKSEFDTPGPLLDDDDKMEAIWKSQYSLQEFLDPKNFKSYAQLKQRLDRVTGAAPSQSAGDDFIDNYVDKESMSPKVGAAPVFKSKEAPSIPADTGDDDSEFEFFASLQDD